MPGRFRSCKHVVWGLSRVRANRRVVEGARISNGEWPKFLRYCSWPISRCVKEEGPGRSCDGTNMMFGQTFLPMATHSTKGKLLTIVITGGLEAGRRMYTVVSSYAFYADFAFSSKCLELRL